MRGDTVLDVRDLRVSFDRPVVHGIAFEVRAGTVTALVGESGSGKTVSCLSSLGLHPAGATVTGAIRIAGRDLASLSKGELGKMRAKSVGFVFQEPRKYLDPSMRIGAQIERALGFGLGLRGAAASGEALSLLSSVGLDARRVAASYPHELSGGMCQRAFIALAICCDPSLLIADEPTTALDASVQRSVLDVLLGFVRDRGMGMVLVSHDLRAVDYSADFVNVMLSGYVVESGPKSAVIENPAHPYTRLLLDALPDEGFVGRKAARAASRDADAPGSSRDDSACPFVGRCRLADVACHWSVPPLVAGEDGTSLRCLKGGLRR